MPPKKPKGKGKAEPAKPNPPSSAPPPPAPAPSPPPPPPSSPPPARIASPNVPAPIQDWPKVETPRGSYREVPHAQQQSPDGDQGWNQDGQSRFYEGGAVSEADDGWENRGADPEDDEMWGGGGSGSRANNSPVVGTRSPTLNGSNQTAIGWGGKEGTTGGWGAPPAPPPPAPPAPPNPGQGDPGSKKGRLLRKSVPISASAQHVPPPPPPPPPAPAPAPPASKPHAARHPPPASHNRADNGGWGAQQGGYADDNWGASSAAPPAPKPHATRHPPPASHNRADNGGWDAPQGGYGAPAGDNWGAPSGGGWGAPSGGGWDAPASDRGAPSGGTGDWGDNGHQGGWGAPEPATSWGRPAAHTSHPSSRAPASAPAPGRAPSIASHPAVARFAGSDWANWANEAKGIRKVTTTTIAASVPVSSSRPPLAPVPASVATPSVNVGSRPVLSGQQQSQLLRSLLSHPGLTRSASLQTGHAPAAPPTQKQTPKASQASQQGWQDWGQSKSQQEWQGWGKSKGQQSPQQQHQRQPSHHAQAQTQSHRPSQIQQQESWGSSGWDTGGGWDSAWNDAIPEEDEEEEDAYDEDLYYNGEEEDEREDEDDYYSSKKSRVHFSPKVSYQYQPPPQSNKHPDSKSHRHRHQSHQSPPAPPPPPAPPSARRHSIDTGGSIDISPFFPAIASKTMSMASRGTTTAFDLAPPRNGIGENVFVDSHGAALTYARRALYGKTRPAKDRIHWMFNPDKDPRVRSLLAWVSAMSNGLATIGLQKFLESGQRGALVSNADYRTPAAPGSPSQPAFDWVTLESLKPSMDRILQESVVCYDPAVQVVVFVFLLSKTGNSMAMWRKKLPIPESLQVAYQEQIDDAVEASAVDNVVYVDEIPSKEPPPVEKKKKRGFWKRLFGLR